MVGLKVSPPLREAGAFLTTMVMRNDFTRVLQDDVKAIDKKARKVLRLVKHGIPLTKTSPNITRILDLLTK